MNCFIWQMKNISDIVAIVVIKKKEVLYKSKEPRTLCELTLIISSPDHDIIELVFLYLVVTYPKVGSCKSGWSGDVGGGGGVGVEGIDVCQQCAHHCRQP